MSKSWSDVEKEYAMLLNDKERIAQGKTFLNSIYGRVKHNIVAMDDYVDTDIVHKNINKKWRMMKIMDELEKNSFIKMFTDGWCATCNFDSAKCAEQKECEAYKIISQQWSDKGGDDDEETV